MLEGDPILIGHVFWVSLHGAIVLKMAGKLSAEFDFERICNEIILRPVQRLSSEECVIHSRAEDAGATTA